MVIKGAPRINVMDINHTNVEYILPAGDNSYSNILTSSMMFFIYECLFHWKHLNVYKYA